MKTFEQFYQLRENYPGSHEDFDAVPGPEEDFAGQRDYEGQKELEQQPQELPVEIDGRPVTVSRDMKQLVHDNQIIGEIRLEGPQQKPTVYVISRYEDRRQEIQAAIDHMLGS